MEFDLAGLVVADLQGAGADLFSRLLSRSLSGMQALKQLRAQMIFAPTDEALTQLFRQTGTTIATFLGTPSGDCLVSNHLGLKFSTIDPTIPTLVGKSVAVGQADIQNLGVVRAFKSQNIIPVLIISTVLTDAQELQTLARREGNPILDALGQQNVNNLITIGGIKGKDLISLCLSNAEMNEFCDRKDDTGRTIFHQLLERDYGIKLEPNRNARRIYRDAVDAAVYYVDPVRLKQQMHDNEGALMRSDLVQIPGGPYKQCFVFSLRMDRATSVDELPGDLFGSLRRFIALTVDGRIKILRNTPENDGTFYPEIVILTPTTQIKKLVHNRDDIYALGESGDLYVLRPREAILTRVSPQEVDVLDVVFTDMHSTVMYRKGGEIHSGILTDSVYAGFPTTSQTLSRKVPQDSELELIDRGELLVINPKTGHCALYDSIKMYSLFFRTDSLPSEFVRCSASRVFSTTIPYASRPKYRGTRVYGILDGQKQIWIYYDDSLGKSPGRWITNPVIKLNNVVEYHGSPEARVVVEFSGLSTVGYPVLIKVVVGGFIEMEIQNVPNFPIMPGRRNTDTMPFEFDP